MGDSDDNKDSDVGFGSRFMNGLKDLILEDETPARPEPTNEGHSAPTKTPPLSNISASSIQSAANSQMTSNLMELVLNRATAYTALTEAMTPLEEIIPDEMTRYRAAFAVIKKNRSLEQVIQAIDLQHMQALESEIARFGDQAKGKEASDVDARIKEAQILRDNIEAANLQVIALRKELEDRIRSTEEGMQRDRQRVEDIDREVEEKRRAIASVQRQFDSAAAAVKESLIRARANILKYLSN